MDTNRIPKQALQYKSGYNTYRGWTQIEYQNKHCNIKKGQRNRGRLRKRWKTNFIFRIKEQETRLILHEHNDDDDDHHH